MLAENVSLRWVHSGAQVADALTSKEMECSFLRHVLRAGKYGLHDQEQILKERASARNRLKWLQNQENTTKRSFGSVIPTDMHLDFCSHAHSHARIQ